MLPPFKLGFWTGSFGEGLFGVEIELFGVLFNFGDLISKLLLGAMNSLGLFSIDFGSSSLIMG
jgi:hypothetical protein